MTARYKRSNNLKRWTHLLGDLSVILLVHINNWARKILVTFTYTVILGVMTLTLYCRGCLNLGWHSRSKHFLVHSKYTFHWLIATWLWHYKYKVMRNFRRCCIILGNCNNNNTMADLFSLKVGRVHWHDLSYLLDLSISQGKSRIHFLGLLECFHFPYGNYTFHQISLQKKCISLQLLSSQISIAP